MSCDKSLIVMLHFYYVNPQSQQYTTTYIHCCWR